QRNLAVPGARRVADPRCRPGQHTAWQIAGSPAQQEEAAQPAVDVRPGYAKLMAVEPERGRPLIVAVLENRGARSPVDPEPVVCLRAEPVVERADSGEPAGNVAGRREE